MSFRKNVYVLGAGFSADAGAPVMRDFFSRARNLKDDPNSRLFPQEREIFGRVIQYRFELDKALAKVLVDLDNIEQLFGFLEMDLRLSAQGNASLRSDMIYVIARTLELTSTKDVPLQQHSLLASVVGGFRTGDMVRAVVTKGKIAKTYTGRIAIRGTGSCNIKTKQGAIQGIHYRYCKPLHRGDGYSYEKGACASSL